MLENLPVYNDKEFQFTSDKSGYPLSGIFVFRPIAIDRLFDKQFKEGQTVTLITLD
jgi:hypothetical protein